MRCRIHDYTLFYNDLNDLVQEQKEAGILTSYSYPPPEGTNWLEVLLPYLVMAVVFGGMWYFMNVRGTGRHGAGSDVQIRHGANPRPEREG